MIQRGMGLVALVLALTFGCGGGLRPVGAPSPGLATASPPVLRGAIDQALARLRMRVVDEREGALLAQWGDSVRKGFRFEIAMSEQGYTVTFVDSVGMKQQVDPRTGSVVVHARYHKLIAKFHKLVARYLGSEGVATEAAVAGVGGQTRLIETGGPVDAGLLQRGFLVAGLQIDQANPAAGIVTTGYVDTGFGYGFIEGEGATLHVAYTGTVYPTEVRITQQVQRCARVYVQAGLGAVQELRCEPFTGNVPSQVSARLDEVSAVVERELRAMAPAAPNPPPTTTTTTSGGLEITEAAACTGQLPSGEVRQVIAAQQGSVRACFDGALSQDPNLSGTVQLTLEVGPDGSVTSAHTGGNMSESSVPACVQALAMSWRFPQVTGGGCATVAIPFNFHR